MDKAVLQIVTVLHI